MEPRKPALMIVDDDARLRRAYVRMLGQTYEITEANGVQDALRQIHTLDPDVVLCDILMGDGTGVDLHRLLVETPWARRFVFTTGGCSKEHEVYVRVCGLPLLEKPADLNKLFETLAAVAT